MALKNILNIIANNGGSPSKKEPDPTPAETPIKERTFQQKRFGDAVARRAQQMIINDQPYELAESATKKGIDPSLTCIGAACNIYKDFGVDFSMFGGEAEGVRESRTGGKVVEYNPTFEQNYAKAGFEKLKGRPVTMPEIADMAKNKQLAPGMLIQQYNDKGVPDHTNIVLKANPDGTYQVYNAFKHSTSKNRGSKDDYVYTLNPFSESFKDKKFNVFTMSDEMSQKLNFASVDPITKQGIKGGAQDTADEYQIDEMLETMYIPRAWKEIQQMDRDTKMQVFGKEKPNRDDIFKYAFADMLRMYQNSSEKENFQGFENPGTRPKIGGGFTLKDVESMVKSSKGFVERMLRGGYGIDYVERMKQNLMK
jgi:hypothetical protein